MRDAPLLREHLSIEDAEHFAHVRELLDVAGVAYELDPTLVRGLDYYTRTVFEFTSDALGAQSGVGGGGRYDGLVEQLGGPATPGVGWAAGIERIMLAGDGLGAGRGSAAHAPAPLELFVALDGTRSDLRAEAFGLLSQARSAGLSAQMDLAGRSLKGQLGHADALGARYVAIVGDAHSVLKDMQGGGQQELATDMVVHARAARPPRDLIITSRRGSPGRSGALPECRRDAPANRDRPSTQSGCALARASNSESSSCSVVAGTGWVALIAVIATSARPTEKPSTST